MLTVFRIKPPITHAPELPPLRYLRAALAAITYNQCFFPTCYDPEFIAQKGQDFIGAVGAKTAYIEPGSPWKNGYCETLNARFRNELLNGEIFYSLREANSCSSGGAATTKPAGRKVLWDTARPRQKVSSRWTRSQSCTSL